MPRGASQREKNRTGAKSAGAVAALVGTLQLRRRRRELLQQPFHTLTNCVLYAPVCQSSKPGTCSARSGSRAAVQYGPSRALGLLAAKHPDPSYLPRPQHFICLVP